jgi:hypothetical protein
MTLKLTDPAWTAKWAERLAGKGDAECKVLVQQFRREVLEEAAVFLDSKVSDYALPGSAPYRAFLDAALAIRKELKR